ncbi:MAG: SpoIIE family protein phosphatase [Desulfobacteraceae bacterium]|nr:SpoIIE family protein phosphatase [Desulfobacteraceae bacterium]
MIEDNPPDLILLDIMMPDIDGFEVCEKLKNFPGTKDIPVIFLTARTETEDIVRGFEIGAVDYITKPFNTAELVARVHTHLELKKNRDLILYANKRLKLEISERKQAQDELRKANDYLKNVFENSAEAIIILDKKGGCIHWNIMAEELFGYKLEDIRGRRISELYSDENELEKMLAELRQKGLVKKYEIYMKKKDGSNFPCEVSIGLLHDDKDETIGSVVIIGSDLTDLKMAQAEYEMINELLKNEVEERKKVQNELKQAKDNLEAAFEKAEKERKAAETANMKIMDSIRYAKNIQGSMLPDMDEVKTYMPDSFFIWMPRDIVGGDIFYTDSFEDGLIVAVIDCTGHGVPGAFMTMIASSFIRRVTRTFGCHDPAEILKQMNSIIKTSLQQDTEHALSDDGMDAGICYIRPEHKTLTFAGARLPLFYVHNRKETVIKGDRQSIGYRRSDVNFDFTNHTIHIEKGMRFYMTTDGFTDQLGRENSACFGKKRLKNLLKEIADKPFEKQENMLIRAFEEYRGENERTDDVTVVGFET